MPQPVRPGTLDLLALKAVSLGAAHGFAIMERIQRGSRDCLQVEQGALYPALHRLEAQGLIAGRWGVSDSNRRAKYYTLTAAGKRRLALETELWLELAAGMQALLQTTSPEQIA